MAARCRVRRPSGPFEPVSFAPRSSLAPPRVAARADASVGPARAIAAGAEDRPIASCVAIGISTGGPQTLTRVFAALRPPIPPILVVQHMPAQFTGALAARLDRLCAVSVAEAENGEKITPDRILIAHGDRHLAVVGRPRQARVSLRDEPPVSGHRPSVDVLFESVARVFGPQAVAVIMTGMGRDGVEGCKLVRAAGGLALGQDEASSTIYGMNKAAFEERAVSSQFHVDELPAIIRKLETDRKG
jgi:two-component system chemotaxis response regulator CheB